MFSNISYNEHWTELKDLIIIPVNQQVTPFWLDDMYLLNPIALPINSSPFYLFPRQQFKTSTDQLRLATQVIQFAYDFKTRIEGSAILTQRSEYLILNFWNRESLSQDFGSGHGKGQPLCMQTYKHFFTAYRVPGEEKDQLMIVDHSLNQLEHIVIACRNQVCSSYSSFVATSPQERQHNNI